METTFVQASKIETLEQYVAALVACMITIRTLEAYHLKALQIGILTQDEEELAKTLVWELKRLLQLYQRMGDTAFDRAQLNPAKILKELRKQSISQAEKLVKKKPPGKKKP